MIIGKCKKCKSQIKLIKILDKMFFQVDTIYYNPNDVLSNKNYFVCPVCNTRNTKFNFMRK